MARVFCERMKLFITGSSGKLGRALLPQLISKKRYFIILLNRKEVFSKQHDRIRVIKGDLQNTASYSNALAGVHTLLHMGAITHTNLIKEYFQVNTEATGRLIHAAKEVGVKRFIYVSSLAISPQGGAYCKSKSMAEDLLKKSGLNWVIIRPAEIYGLSPEETIGKLIRLIHKSPIIPILGDGEYKLSPVFAEDVVGAIVRIIEDPNLTEKEYNLTGPEEYSYNDFIRLLLKLSGKKRYKIHIPVLFVEFVARYFAHLGTRKPPIVIDQIPRLLSPKPSGFILANKDLYYNPQHIQDVVSDGKRLLSLYNSHISY